MKNLKFCAACMADQNYDVREDMETYPVKGESITIEANVAYCKVCGEQIWDQELDDKNLVKAFCIYREKHNLLQPEEIEIKDSIEGKVERKTC